ncbi:membrane protein [Pilimelia terevasa]|uniref:Membrane protein n=1 Tax=Pilimelia terevasa TaxID=53372 RepID=A0A8J3BE31_9ACTN|nr:Bax inhibitor-1/YccA family protein [Pilimelia terevasa]GGK14710.1 membrane protein [Pilimelia terevasa]
MESRNPVLSRLGEAAQRELAGTAPQAGQAYPTGAGFGAAPPQVAPMSIDDVVVRTVGLLALVAVAGGVAWQTVPVGAGALPWLIGAAVAGLVLGLVISFARITNPLVIGLYALCEGVFLGVVSRLFEASYPGIVVQAAIGTFGTFFLMAALYRARFLRATPRFTKIVIGAVIGVCGLMLANLLLGFAGVNLGLRDGGPLAIGFSVVCIAVAALTFVLDFHQVEEAVRYGLPRKFAWSCAFGIVVGLVWLYLEFLRLISYFRD